MKAALPIARLQLQRVAAREAGSDQVEQPADRLDPQGKVANACEGAGFLALLATKLPAGPSRRTAAGTATAANRQQPGSRAEQRTEQPVQTQSRRQGLAPAARPTRSPHPELFPHRLADLVRGPARPARVHGAPSQAVAPDSKEAAAERRPHTTESGAQAVARAHDGGRPEPVTPAGHRSPGANVRPHDNETLVGNQQPAPVQLASEQTSQGPRGELPRSLPEISPAHHGLPAELPAEPGGTGASVQRKTSRVPDKYEHRHRPGTADGKTVATPGDERAETATRRQTSESTAEPPAAGESVGGRDAARRVARLRAPLVAVPVAGVAAGSSPPATPAAGGAVQTPAWPAWLEQFVDGSARWIAASPAGKSRVVMRLDPPELGLVEIRLERGRRGLDIRMDCTRPETLRRIEAAAPQLLQRLEQLGVETGELDLFQRPAGGEPEARPEARHEQSPRPAPATVARAVSPRPRPAGAVDLVA